MCSSSLSTVSCWLAPCLFNGSHLCSVHAVSCLSRVRVLRSKTAFQTATTAAERCPFNDHAAKPPSIHPQHPFFSFLFGVFFSSPFLSSPLRYCIDLRVQLGGDGNAIANSPTMITPNLDKLIGKGLFLRKAQVQQAVCSPTRTSILTSRYPDATRVWDLYVWKTPTLPTLPPPCSPAFRVNSRA